MSDSYNPKVHNVELYLRHLKKAHDLVKWSANELKRQFEEIIEPNLRIGTVVDLSAIGQAYGATVLRGRGYGFHYRIESKVSVEVAVSHPSLSRWSVNAISVDPTDHTRTLGKQVWLKGMVFPAPLVKFEEHEHNRTLKAVQKLLGEYESKGVVHV